MRKIGLHLRLTTTLLDLLRKALRLGTPIVQCFFITQGGNSYTKFIDSDFEECQELRKQLGDMFLHASYWVNLAGCRNNGWRAFQHELALAHKLGFTHIIIHPGSATGCESKEEGIHCLARALNKALTMEKNIKIVLENTAHSRKTVGGNFNDFKELLKLLDEPERVFFCLDSAHAHSYGYDITDPIKQDIFLNDVERILGKGKIALIHLNETSEKRGSYIDRHAEFGKGVIGNDALQRFMNHPVCKDIPIILEIPVLETEDDEKDVLKLVQSWDSVQ